MPFVNIYLPSAFTTEERAGISLSVHDSLVAIFKIPEKDYFQVIHPVQPENLRYPDIYLDIPHTPDLIYIQVFCGDGRTKAMKEALYALIAEKIAACTPVRPDDIIIILAETKRENWSFGRGIAQMNN